MGTKHNTPQQEHTNNTIVKYSNQMQPPARTIVVVVDVSKAFDTVNIHTHTHRKAATINIIPTTIKFSPNYIKGHKAYTTFSNHTSPTC